MTEASSSPPPLPLEQLASIFVTTLREEGVTTGIDGTVTYARALAAVGLTSESLVYWAGRTTLAMSPEDVEAYDRAFQRFWQRGPFPEPVSPPSPQEEIAVFDDPDLENGSGDQDERPGIEVRYSADERLAERDLSTLTEEQISAALRMIERLDLALPLRATRRRRPGGTKGERLDTRRTVQRALRTQGELIRRPTTRRRHRERRLVLLCDVSGSMDPYAQALLRFLHVAVASGHPVEAFTFATRLTRVTRHLHVRRAEAALAAASAAVPDISGGTRLGEILREFNDRWGVRGLARGAIVVILSDGWDRGCPEQLGAEMRRLRRVADRIIWVNPLKASPDYQPLARGMAAALPSVDEFVTGHSVDALAQLAARLAQAISTATSSRHTAPPALLR